MTTLIKASRLHLRWVPSALVCLFFLFSGIEVVEAQAPVLTIVEPAPGIPIFGETSFQVEILEGEAQTVRFLVDGRPVGESSGPEFKITVDVGEDNAPHRFEAIAVSASGEEGTALLVSPAIQVDEEVDAELRQLYVTVSRQGQRVLSLEQDQFRIYDNGYQQRMVTFGRGDVRLTGRTIDRLEHQHAGAVACATLCVVHKPSSKVFARCDDASVLLFSDRILRSTPFSNDIESLMTQLGGVDAAGGTALNDHLYLSLKRLEDRQGRRVVVILSDGIDSHSVLRMSDIRWGGRAQSGPFVLDSGPRRWFRSNQTPLRLEESDRLQRGVSTSDAGGGDQWWAYRRAGTSAGRAGCVPGDPRRAAGAICARLLSIRNLAGRTIPSGGGQNRRVGLRGSDSQGLHRAIRETARDAIEHLGPVCKSQIFRFKGLRVHRSASSQEAWTD